MSKKLWQMTCIITIDVATIFAMKTWFNIDGYELLFSILAVRKNLQQRILPTFYNY